MEDTAAKFHIAILESLTELVNLAAALLDARFAILRLHDDGTIIVNDQAAPKEAAQWASYGFYTSVDIRDANDRNLGTLVAVDSGKREPAWTDQQVLSSLAAQVARLIRSETLFRETEMRADRLETLLDASPVAAYMVEEGRLTCVNAKLAQTTGYTKEEILRIGDPTEFVVPEQREYVREMIRRRQSGEQEDIRYITRIRCRDGRIVDAEVHGSTAFVDRRRALIGVVIDISKQATEQRQAKEREEYLRALTENVSDVIVILDRSGFISYVTPSIETMLGYSAEQAGGTKFTELIHPDDRSAVERALQQLARSPHAPAACASYRFREESGAWKWLESVGTNLLNHPQVRGIVLNVRDISERKRLEEQGERLHRLTSLGRLAAQVAHEFNNVLMGVSPFAEVIRRVAGDDPQVERAVDAISSAVARGKRITTDILRFGRPAVPTLTSVNVQQVLRQTLNEIRAFVPPNVTLVEEAADEPMFIHADPSQMSQVLINLAINAIDAMRASGGTLRVSVREDAHHCAHFTIADTGEGIPESDLPYIFEPHFSTKNTGSGLGLSVVWQIVVSHGGRISVESERGKGTTFQVSIPLAHGEPESPRFELPRSATRDRRRILIVDDNETIAEGLRWTLDDEGFDVVLAATGEEALDRVREGDIDLVVLDLSLHNEDGRDIYKRIASIDPIPVIFSSGHRNDQKDAPHEQSASLLKPYSTEELIREIDRLLQSRRTATSLPN